MNQNVVTYFQENKDKYSQETLAGQLRGNGYPEQDIQEGASFVYGGSQNFPPVPQSGVVPVKYAGFWVRFAASFIDGLVLLIPNAIISFFFNLNNLQLAGTLTSYLLLWLYYILMTNKYQATLGKKALGIMVISDNSANLSLGQIILRETIGKIVSMITLFVGYIMAGFTERKQALHDKIAGTLVIHKDPNKNSNGLVIGLVIGFVLIIPIIGILSSIVLVSLSSAREKAKEAAFKSEVMSIVPGALIACDEKNVITVKDLGSPQYFDSNTAIKTLEQDCGSDEGATFSISIEGTNGVSSSAECTENGCTFS